MDHPKLSSSDMLSSAKITATPAFGSQYVPISGKWKEKLKPVDEVNSDSLKNTLRYCSCAGTYRIEDPDCDHNIYADCSNPIHTNDWCCEICRTPFTPTNKDAKRIGVANQVACCECFSFDNTIRERITIASGHLRNEKGKKVSEFQCECPKCKNYAKMSTICGKCAKYIGKVARCKYCDIPLTKDDFNYGFRFMRYNDTFSFPIVHLVEYNGRILEIPTQAMLMCLGCTRRIIDNLRCQDCDKKIADRFCVCCYDHNHTDGHHHQAHKVYEQTSFNINYCDKCDKCSAKGAGFTNLCAECGKKRVTAREERHKQKMAKYANQ